MPVLNTRRCGSGLPLAARHLVRQSRGELVPPPPLHQPLWCRRTKRGQAAAATTAAAAPAARTAWLSLSVKRFGLFAQGSEELEHPAGAAPPPRVAPLRLTSVHCSNGRDSPPTHWPWACHLAHHSKASGPCLVLQVLLSLQALVLVEQPYFNEPGCEGDAHTPAGPNPKPKLFKGAVCCTVLRALCAAQCCVRCVRYAACGERPPPASRCLLWFGFSPCYGVCEQPERTDTAAQLQAMLRQHDITKGPRC